MIQFRQAIPTDLDCVMEIIRHAQTVLQNSGSTQWQDGYPAPHNIESDIARGYGIVACSPEGNITAYAAVIFDGEPAYEQINGNWYGDNTDYVVVHRLAVAGKTKQQGIATAFIRHVITLAREHGIGSFRIDTAHENHIMQHMLDTLEFTYRGEIRYGLGVRMAFEKLL